MLALLAVVLVAALGPGYLIWLGRRRQPLLERSRTSAPLPPVAIVVPLFNEIAWTNAKIHNLRTLDYPPGRLKIWIVDGASSDGTADAVLRAVRGDPRFELLREPTADKTAQLNAALERVSAAWVMVTDADARLSPDTLTTMVRAGESDAEVAVVGTPVEPGRTHPLERLHWQITNYLRHGESLRGSASIVAAPCYLFRRSLIERFPPDVVADDIHVAFAAAAAGRRVGFVDANVTELRSPARLTALFRHKRRKADAYVREIFRFLPHLGRMPACARNVFLWRAAQLLIIPLLAVTGLAGLVIWTAAGHLPAAAAETAAVTALVLGAGVWRRWSYVSAAGLLVALGALLVVVMLAVLVAYPFSRQTACYPKVAAAIDRAPGELAP